MRTSFLFIGNACCTSLDYSYKTAELMQPVVDLAIPAGRIGAGPGQTRTTAAILCQ